MGFELEISTGDLAPVRRGDWRLDDLERRWRHADERLRAAIAREVHARRLGGLGDPERIAAQLELAWARHRFHEADRALRLLYES
jgi:hypothetical protein